MPASARSTTIIRLRSYACLQAVRLKRTADEKKQQGNAKYEQNDFRCVWCKACLPRRRVWHRLGGLGVQAGVAQQDKRCRRCLSHEPVRTAERWYTEAIDLLEQQLPGLGLSEQQAAALFPNLKTEVAVLYSNRCGRAGAPGSRSATLLCTLFVWAHTAGRGGALTACLALP